MHFKELTLASMYRMTSWGTGLKVSKELGGLINGQTHSEKG